MQMRSLVGLFSTTIVSCLTAGTLAACSATTNARPLGGTNEDATTVEDASGAVDASTPRSSDATPDAAVDATPNPDKAVGCASTFGNALTDAFGRIDGTVEAVLKPAHPTCAQPNRTHLILQVRMQGAVYRMVVNVASSKANPNIWFRALPHTLPQPAWQEGWHPGLTLDYAKDLDVHKNDLVETTTMDLVDKVYTALDIGSTVSVYSSSSGGQKADSAHLIHRTGKNDTDGAIVLNPKSATPTFLVFSFEEQTF
jgi:hypothetical protein